MLLVFMKRESILPRNNLYLRTKAGVFLAVLVSMLTVGGAANVALWDTSAPIGNGGLSDRAKWKSVPSELFALEAEPAKAASDPGYYGREYAFSGDAAVENSLFVAVCSSATGRIYLYAKSPSATPEKVVELAPLPRGDRKQFATSIIRSDIVRNGSDEVILKVTFSDQGVESPLVVSFGKDSIVEIKTPSPVSGVRVFSSIQYGAVPAFGSDDLIVNPKSYAANEALTLPAEHAFIGLLQGGNHELVMTWGKGRQRITLPQRSTASTDMFDAVDISNDGQSVYIAALIAPQIWHKEELKPTFLERDIKLAWQRPFPAKWKTQFTEAGVRTTFAFRESKGTVWRGVPGSYNYPAWFDGDTAFYHLSKKVPPKGESLIYFLEGQNTPVTVTTPADVVKATLGRELAENVLDPTGRKLRTHHRRGGDGVHRACTCGCTEAIQAVFEAKQEAMKGDYVQAALGDMNFFVECHMSRIDEYTQFADSLLQFLKDQAQKSPALGDYITNLQEIAGQIPQEYSVQKENMKSLDHARELTERTMSLTQSKATNNLASYMDLLKAWRAMGGAQDYVVAQCHMITRKLFQEAGYQALTNANAIPLAHEIRARCRQVLRNPDGYEIWANY